MSKPTRLSLLQLARISILRFWIHPILPLYSYNWSTRPTLAYGLLNVWTHGPSMMKPNRWPSVVQSCKNPIKMRFCKLGSVNVLRRYSLVATFFPFSALDLWWTSRICNLEPARNERCFRMGNDHTFFFSPMSDLASSMHDMARLGKRFQDKTFEMRYTADEFAELGVKGLMVYLFLYFYFLRCGAQFIQQRSLDENSWMDDHYVSRGFERNYVVCIVRICKWNFYFLSIVVTKVVHNILR